MKRLLIRVLTALVSMAGAGVLLLPAAFRQRGYFAFGGEWLMVLVFGIIVWWLFSVWEEVEHEI